MKIFRRQKPRTDLAGHGAACMRRTDEQLAAFHRERAERQMRELTFTAFDRAYGLQDR